MSETAATQQPATTPAALPPSEDGFASALATLKGSDAPASKTEPPKADKKDAKTEPKTEAPKPKNSEAWEKAAQAQRKAQEERDALKAEREAWEKSKADAKAQLEIVEAVKAGDFDALAKIVGDDWYDKATRQVLGVTKKKTDAATADAKPNKEVEELRKKVQELESNLTASQQRAIKEETDRYQGRVGELLQSEDYELLAAMPNAQDEVSAFVGKYWEQNKILLTPEEAVGKIQEGLEEFLGKVVLTKRFAARFPLKQGEKQPPSKGLTNKGLATRALAEASDDDDPEASFKKALSLLQSAEASSE